MLKTVLDDDMTKAENNITFMLSSDLIANLYMYVFHRVDFFYYNDFVLSQRFPGLESNSHEQRSLNF